MKLVRWNPFGDLLSLHDHLSSESNMAWSPFVDVFERDDDLVIRAEVPGVDRKDIEVRVENGTLVIHGERKRDTELSEANAYRQERYYGSFTRRFSLPKGLDHSRVQATYKDGVLELTLPKAEEAKPKRIEIRAA